MREGGPNALPGTGSDDHGRVPALAKLGRGTPMAKDLKSLMAWLGHPPKIALWGSRRTFGAPCALNDIHDFVGNFRDRTPGAG
jgi:hypothetical protein